MIFSPIKVLFFSGIALLASFIVFLMFSQGQGGQDNYLILASAVAIIFSVFVTQGIKLHSENRDRAFTVFILDENTKQFQEACPVFSKLISKQKVLTVENIINIFSSDDEDVKKTAEAILYIANFFEQMAIAIRYNEVHEPLLREFYIGNYVRFYRCIKHILPLIRGTTLIPNSPFGKDYRPDVLCNLDWLYKQWMPKYIKMLGKLGKINR